MLVGGRKGSDVFGTAGPPKLDVDVIVLKGGNEAGGGDPLDDGFDGVEVGDH